MGRRPYALKRRMQIAFTDEDGQTCNIGISWANPLRPDFSPEGYLEIQRIISRRNSTTTISEMKSPANPSTYNQIPTTENQMTNSTINSIHDIQLNTNEEPQFFDFLSFLKTSNVSSSDGDGQSSGNSDQSITFSNLFDGFDDPSFF